MLWHKKALSVPVLARRTFRTRCVLHATHYDELGLTPRATQGDIKSAYYKLSKVHHPDLSKSESSARKFRAITEAYEVLGNVQLKKMYDKGLLVGRHNDRMSYKPEPEPTDPTAKFHKSRQYRTVVPTMDGKTPIYNFDAWSKEHYGTVFQRARYEKEMNRRKSAHNQNQLTTIKEETIIYMVFALVTLFAFVAVNGQKNYDLDSVSTQPQVQPNNVASKQNEKGS